MSGIDRDILSRIIDDEATEADRRALGDDPAAQAGLDAMLRQDAAVRDWFDSAAGAQVPPALERAVRNGFKVRRARTGIVRWFVPVAAAAVMVVAGVATFDAMLDRRVNQALEQMRAERASDLALLASAVQDVLEQQPSGAEVRFENAATGFEVTLKPRRTWKSASGHWCREFVEIFDPLATETAPISTACRTPDGRWVRVRTELKTPTTPVLPLRLQNL